MPGGHVPGRHQSFVGDQDRRRRVSAGNQGQGTPRQRPVGRGVPLPDRCARWRTGPVLPQLPFAHAISGAAQHRLVDALVNGVPQCRSARGCCAQCPGRDRGAQLGIPGRHPPVRPEFHYDPGGLVDWFGTQLLAKPAGANQWRRPAQRRAGRCGSGGRPAATGQSPELIVYRRLGSLRENPVPD
ncbi:hypothetical protein D3C87_1534400 [compost metagenome]